MALGLAAILAVPVFRAVEIVTGNSGFSPDLASRFDLVLWWDIMDQTGPVLAAAFRQLIWALPLFLVWKAASQVGLIHALKDDSEASFWEGVARFTPKALGLTLLYMLLGVLAVGALWTTVASVSSSLGSPGLMWTPAQFWTLVVVGPLATVVILAILDLMQDYARMHLVLRGKGIWDSFVLGSSWPFRKLWAIALYKIWFFAAAVVWLLPFWVDGRFSKTTIGGMLLAFLVQQVVIFLRQGVSVAWIGSETACFETLAEEPEIDEDKEEEGWGGQDSDLSEGRSPATSEE